MRTGVALLVLLVLAAGQADAETWSRYTNPNYGTSLEIPTSEVGVIHKTARKRNWLAGDRTVIMIEGERWTEAVASWKAYHQDHLDGMREEGITITQNSGGSTWFTVWGRKGSGWVYLHVMRSPRCKDLAHGLAVITQARPSALHRRWIERMTASLQDRPSRACP